jgi:hypothetical protein
MQLMLSPELLVLLAALQATCAQHLTDLQHNKSPGSSSSSSSAASSSSSSSSSSIAASSNSRSSHSSRRRAGQHQTAAANAAAGVEGMSAQLLKAAGINSLCGNIRGVLGNAAEVQQAAAQNLAVLRFAVSVHVDSLQPNKGLGAARYTTCQSCGAHVPDVNVAGNPTTAAGSSNSSSCSHGEGSSSAGQLTRHQQRLLSQPLEQQKLPPQQQQQQQQRTLDRLLPPMAVMLVQLVCGISDLEHKSMGLFVLVPVVHAAATLGEAVHLSVLRSLAEPVLLQLLPHMQDLLHSSGCAKWHVSSSGSSGGTSSSSGGRSGTTVAYGDLYAAVEQSLSQLLLLLAQGGEQLLHHLAAQMLLRTAARTAIEWPLVLQACCACSPFRVMAAKAGAFINCMHDTMTKQCQVGPSLSPSPCPWHSAWCMHCLLWLQHLYMLLPPTLHLHNWLHVFCRADSDSREALSWIIGSKQEQLLAAYEASVRCCACLDLPATAYNEADYKAAASAASTAEDAQFAAGVAVASEEAGSRTASSCAERPQLQQQLLALQISCLKCAMCATCGQGGVVYDGVHAALRVGSICAQMLRSLPPVSGTAHAGSSEGSHACAAASGQLAAPGVTGDASSSSSSSSSLLWTSNSLQAAVKEGGDAAAATAVPWVAVLARSVFIATASLQPRSSDQVLEDDALQRQTALELGVVNECAGVFGHLLGLSALAEDILQPLQQQLGAIKQRPSTLHAAVAVCDSTQAQQQLLADVTVVVTIHVVDD